MSSVESVKGIVKQKNIEDVCVIGIGRFGEAVVRQLVEMKVNVLALDKDENNLKDISRITNVAVVEGTDVQALKALGVNNFKTVIVGSSENIETVATLMEIGVPHLIVKAKNALHEKVLKQIGVNVIVMPEREAGIRTALIATSENFIKYSQNLQEIGDGYALGSTIVRSRDWFGKQLKDIKFNSTFGVSVVSIRRDGKVYLPSGDATIEEDDLITLIGRIQNITHIFGTLNENFESTKKVKTVKAETEE